MHVPAKLLVFMEVTCVFIDQEVVSWKTQWDAKNHCDTPDTITGTLTSTSVSYVRFPNIVTILRLLLLVPVTAASAERAHSALKLVKTDRRSTMTEDRMTALLLLHVHKDIALDYGKVIDKFASMKPRRMLLSNPFADDL